MPTEDLRRAFRQPVGVQARFMSEHGRRASLPGDWQPFGVWWTSPVLAEDAPGPWHSRRQLILAVANKEGGSHVDPKRAPWYGRIASGEAMLMRLTGPDGELLVRHPSLASVRQVAQEVEQALVRRFPELGG